MRRPCTAGLFSPPLRPLALLPRRSCARAARADGRGRAAHPRHRHPQFGDPHDGGPLPPDRHQGERIEGTFFLERPGKIRFRYNPPSSEEIISVGRGFYVINREEQTQYAYPQDHVPLRQFLDRRDRLLQGQPRRLQPTPTATRRSPSPTTRPPAWSRSRWSSTTRPTICPVDADRAQRLRAHLLGSTTCRRTLRSRAATSTSTRPTRRSIRRHKPLGAAPLSAPPDARFRRHLEHQFGPPAHPHGAEVPAHPSARRADAAGDQVHQRPVPAQRPSPRPAGPITRCSGQKGYHGVAIVSRLPLDRHHDPRLLRHRPLPPHLRRRRSRAAGR